MGPNMFSFGGSKPECFFGSICECPKKGLSNGTAREPCRRLACAVVHARRGYFGIRTPQTCSNPVVLHARSRSRGTNKSGENVGNSYFANPRGPRQAVTSFAEISSQPRGPLWWPIFGTWKRRGRLGGSCNGPARLSLKRDSWPPTEGVSGYWGSGGQCRDKVQKARVGIE